MTAWPMMPPPPATRATGFRDIAAICMDLPNPFDAVVYDARTLTIQCG
jgi:hypothetical protein